MAILKSRHLHPHWVPQNRMSIGSGLIVIWIICCWNLISWITLTISTTAILVYTELYISVQEQAVFSICDIIMTEVTAVRHPHAVQATFDRRAGHGCAKRLRKLRYQGVCASKRGQRTCHLCSEQWCESRIYEIKWYNGNNSISQKL